MRSWGGEGKSLALPLGKLKRWSFIIVITTPEMEDGSSVFFINQNGCKNCNVSPVLETNLH